MKSRNAYLVFYDRIVDEDWPDSDEEEVEEAYPNEVVTLPDEIKEMITISNKKYWQNKFLFAQEYLNKFAEIFTYWNTSVVIPYQFSTRVDDKHLYPFKKPVKSKNIYEPSPEFFTPNDNVKLSDIER